MSAKSALKTIVCLLLSGVTLAAGPTTAPRKPKPYLADYVWIVDHMQEVKAKQQELESRMRQIDAAVQKKRDRVIKLQSELKQMEKDSAEALAQQEVLDKARTEMVDFMTTKRKELEPVQSEMLKQLGMEVDAATLEVAKKHGLEVTIPGKPFPEKMDNVTPAQLRPMVLGHQIRRAEGMPDLTEEVLKLLNERYAKSAATKPATLPTGS